MSLQCEWRINHVFPLSITEVIDHKLSLLFSGTHGTYPFENALYLFEIGLHVFGIGFKVFEIGLHLFEIRFYLFEIGLYLFEFGPKKV